MHMRTHTHTQVQLIQTKFNFTLIQLYIIIFLVRHIFIMLDFMTADASTPYCHVLSEKKNSAFNETQIQAECHLPSQRHGLS
jgi:hypothetical protein